MLIHYVDIEILYIDIEIPYIDIATPNVNIEILILKFLQLILWKYTLFTCL